MVKKKPKGARQSGNATPFGNGEAAKKKKYEKVHLSNHDMHHRTHLFSLCFLPAFHTPLINKKTPPLSSSLTHFIIALNILIYA